MGAMKKIIILHGWTTSTDKWDDFLKALKEKDIKGVILKIPGLTEKLEAVWSLDDYVSWLKKELGNEKVVLLGHSNGGRIALAFSNKYPTLVKKLILVGSAGIYHKNLKLQLKRLIFKTMAKIGKRFTASEKLRSILYKLAKENDYKNADILQRQTMVNLISSDLTSILKQINTPTLIIWGNRDQTTPLSDGELMNKSIKNSILKIIGGAAHSPQFTHPKEVAKIIDEYL